MLKPQILTALAQSYSTGELSASERKLSFTIFRRQLAEYDTYADVIAQVRRIVVQEDQSRGVREP